MRVTLWALMGAGGELSRAHARHTASRLFLNLSRFFAAIGITSVTALPGIQWILFCVGSSWFCLYLRRLAGPVFSISPCHQISSHRRHGLGIFCRSTTAGHVMLANTLAMTSRSFPASSAISGRVSFPHQVWWVGIE